MLPPKPGRKTTGVGGVGVGVGGREVGVGVGELGSHGSSKLQTITLSNQTSARGSPPVPTRSPIFPSKDGLLSVISKICLFEGAYDRAKYRF